VSDNGTVLCKHGKLILRDKVVPVDYNAALQDDCVR
jgi:hypothetical protein